ncbi:hypothetical protein LUZ61_005752 [Rhynchospora tenuis]|uniref:non-specific serine/threonine protein kinase n=1 Tax=Rhynchospora tenuis TaxID=198213 RepID=A0AAD5ZQ54_9POAL|nr:hypothetical protein LUZ61_005752 [Rhynchospora tenuis]
MLHFFFLLFLSQFLSIKAINYLDHGDSLSVEEPSNVLKSPSGTFTCGFYEISPNTFTFSIWFSNSANHTVVWTANHAEPVYGLKSMIKFSKDGDLVLNGYDGCVVWATHTSSKGDPEANLWGNNRISFSSIRNGSFDVNGLFTSSDGLRFEASDLGSQFWRRLTLDPDGNLRLYSLNESDGSWSVSWIAVPQHCRVHGFCGRNGICIYAPNATCTCPPGYKMNDLSNWRKGVEFRNWGSYIGDCYLKDHLFNGKFRQGFQGDFYLKLPRSIKASELAIPKVQTPILFFISFGCWFTFRKENSPFEKEGYKLVSSQFRRYTYKELEIATNKFMDVIGRGGSGVVYKGVLRDGRVAAVKKLEEINQGGEEFLAELSVIRQIYHRNLVRIWGFCSDRSHRILVSEYVQNGSLEKALFGTGTANLFLGWKQRYNIAIGVAKGLAYLHHECSEWVVHCDVKPENILLDEDFEPKITHDEDFEPKNILLDEDFGLAKLLHRSRGNSMLSHIRGTRGYIAPE